MSNDANQILRDRKIIQRGLALQRVVTDPNFHLLSAETKAAALTAAEPVGGWEAGLKNLLDYIFEDESKKN